VVKLWRPGQVIASVPTPIVPGRFYHLEVVTTGSRIRVYLDGGATPIIDVTDSTYPSGRFGVNAFNATVTVQNLNVNTGGLTTNITGRWTPTSGTWTEPAGHRKGNAIGDGFLLADQTGADFTYEGDLRVVNGQAAGLTFRANADGTQHYTATIDKAGLVKLWRPGQDIATHTTTIREGKTYHLKVTATGPTIRVYLDGATSPVIDTVDSAFASGRFGLNTFAGTSMFANVTVS
jgi:fructan beta-fructosidase